MQIIMNNTEKKNFKQFTIAIGVIAVFGLDILTGKCSAQYEAKREKMTMHFNHNEQVAELEQKIEELQNENDILSGKKMKIEPIVAYRMYNK